MKIIYSAALIALLVATFYMGPVKADGVVYIDGTVTDAETSEALEDIEVAITNARTLETIYDLTDESGYFYKALTSFQQGWQNEDYINIFVQAEGYAEYFTSAILSNSWCQALTLEIGLVEAVYNQNVLNPFIDYTTQWQLTCVGDAQSLGGNVGWTYLNGATVPVADVDPDYDGVEIQGGLMVQDDGDWVAQGQTWRVYSQFYMRIERYVDQHIFYEQTLNLYYDGHNYYNITGDGYILIDPQHDVKIAKNSVNNIQIKITAILYWQWYYGESYLGGSNTPESQTMTYHWE